jgi:hypothetical protein
VEAIVSDIILPVQDAFDALLIMNLGRLPSWVVLTVRSTSED